MLLKQRSAALQGRIRICRRLARSRLSAPLMLLALLSGCSPPLGVGQLGIDASYQHNNRSALNGGTLSDSTLIVLRRHGLLALWQTNPEQAIHALRSVVLNQQKLWPELFALAELSYLQGKRQNSQQDFLAAALYAYAYLSPGGAPEQPSPYDPKFLQACNIYNLSLAWALTPPGAGPVPLLSGWYKLPFGEIDLQVDQQSLHWRGGDLVDFQATAPLAVSGMQNVYSNPGLGEPLAAKVNDSATSGPGLQIESVLRIPANLLLVLDAPRQQLAQQRLHARLVLHTIYDQESVQIGAATVPLEYDQSATWALSLAKTATQLELLKKFLNGGNSSEQGRLFGLEPHQFGYMPVILIHGTASNPAPWLDMVNDLLQNPTIRQHFEFWFFAYSSGNPIPYSALQLRQSVEAAITQLGGVEADPALGRITLIGHSQGGLLAKMLVIDPGDKLWDGMGLAPLSTMKMSDRSRKLLKRALFPTPVPEIKRVVFIATPQRGSYVAAFSLSQLIARLVSLPSEVTQIGTDIFGGDGSYALIGQTRLRMGSISGMSPDSPFIRSLAAIPVVPNVHVHSIIPVNTNGPIADGNDGVVSYASAHIPGPIPSL